MSRAPLHSHLSVVSDGIVVPLDAGKVGVVLEVRLRLKPVASRAEQARRNGDVADFIVRVLFRCYRRYTVVTLLPTNKLASVGIPQFGLYARRRVAMVAGVPT